MTRKSLYWKLTLSFFLVAFAATAMATIFIRITSQDRLVQLIFDQQRDSMLQSVQNYYTTNGSWEAIGETWDEMQRQTFPPPNPVTPDDDSRPTPNPENSPSMHERRNLFGLAGTDDVVIVSVDEDYPNGSTLPEEIIAGGTAVEVNEKTVGTLLSAQRISRFNPEEALFLKRTNQALLLAIITGLIVALVMGIILARTLTHPLRDLTQAAQNIADGHLSQEVKVTSTDEIGRLAAAFNRMSQQVAKANASRRQMTADIAHDLRTPLTVIAGYIESMKDGVLQPTPERLDLIYIEIERLQNLVGDLRMLSQADAGELALHPQSIAPKALLEQTASVFQHHAARQEVTINVDTMRELPDIFVDEARMLQVMDNLISNALRFTPAGGSITLSAIKVDKEVELSVKDTGTGIESEELPFIFDRFHRIEKSRHADTGESGLGLAIVKALVESQGGHVWAESDVNAGTVIIMRFKV